MKNPIQIWIGRKCIEDAKSKNYNSRFLKVNFPKNKYFPEKSLIVADNIYIILVIFIWYNVERRK